MQTYTVHEPPSPPADRVDRAEGLVFIKDGFTWGAALFGPFWMLLHRLWWPLLGYVVLYGALEGIGMAVRVSQNWIGLSVFALNLLVGFEAATLRRWTLERRGWRTVASVSGRTLDDCERRFFDAWMPSQPVIQAQPSRPVHGSAFRNWPIIGSLTGARG